MEMLGKIRRMYFRDKLSLHQIAKRTGLSRNTIRKWVRAPEATQPAYQRCATFNKLSPFHETLEQALGGEAAVLDSGSALLAKGGHATGEMVEDTLITPDGGVIFANPDRTSPRLNSSH